jgi:16S rRNA pseudouridine516 synthase
LQLDRFLKHHTLHSQKQIRQFIIEGRVMVDGVISKDVQHPVTHFTHVQFNQTVLQAKTPYYLMLNKPAGIVSATSHPHHRTVIDCINADYADQLHLAGRLDFNSTGLMLLTNDGTWSRKITQPEEKFAKTYTVTTADEITPEYITRFASSMYFAYEDMHLQPAELDILSSHSARIRIYEGRYHQIKRMFGSFNNQVLTLHREAMGPIELDPNLSSGEYRPLRADEIRL